MFKKAVYITVVSQMDKSTGYQLGRHKLAKKRALDETLLQKDLEENAVSANQKSEFCGAARSNLVVAQNFFGGLRKKAEDLIRNNRHVKSACFVAALILGYAGFLGGGVAILAEATGPQVNNQLCVARHLLNKNCTDARLPYETVVKIAVETGINVTDLMDTNFCRHYLVELDQRYLDRPALEAGWCSVPFLHHFAKFFGKEVVDKDLISTEEIQAINKKVHGKMSADKAQAQARLLRAEAHEDADDLDGEDFEDALAGLDEEFEDALEA